MGKGVALSLQRESGQQPGAPGQRFSALVSFLVHATAVTAGPSLADRWVLQVACCRRLSLPFSHLCHLEVPSPARSRVQSRDHPSWQDEA